MAYTDIDKSDDYFNTKLYVGNGSANHAITGVGFQPDWVWYKGRNDSEDPKVFDAVRGVTKAIKPNGTDAEFTQSGVTSFNSDGFTLGSHTGGNQNNINFVSWNWLAANGTASNTAGSINSTVSVNTTAGFSIVSYTGDGTNNNTATIGHGLGVAPSMIIVKGINATASWITTNTINGWNNVLELNSAAANAANTYAFGSTGIPPTSTVFTVAAESGQHHTNTNNNTYIAYCFAEKQGFSKFGSYKGNGSSNGAFIYTGFSPAFIMVKSTSSSGQWFMFDNKREGYNPENDRLIADVGDAEADPGQTDFLSNGFKMRFTSGNANGSGVSYIYMAFAENPFVTSTGIPSPAR